MATRRNDALAWLSEKIITLFGSGRGGGAVSIGPDEPHPPVHRIRAERSSFAVAHNLVEVVNPKEDQINPTGPAFIVVSMGNFREKRCRLLLI